MITLTLTSCKRPNLFIETINSFNKNCQDKESICEIIWSDDNSSFEDHEKMLFALYKNFPNIPIIDLYRKVNPGLSFSLNNIYERVKTKYVFHLEDDWKFIEREFFIAKGINFLEKQENIKQVGFRDWCNFFDVKKCTFTGEQYTLWERGIAKNGQYLNHYGFTLNPSIFNLEFYLSKYGWFNHVNIEGSWIASYQDGIRSANFIKNYVVHIGENYSSFCLNATPR